MEKNDMMNEANEALKRTLLMMNYDMKKTLTENVEVVSEQGTKMTDQEKDTKNKPAGKGRPTPTRKEREKANFKPIVGDRSKEARAAARAKSTEANRKARQAMMAGDERYLLSRDKGPQRKIARDFLDSKIKRYWYYWW